MENYHIPVLARESVDLLDIKPDGTYVDLTMGGGGHSRLILGRLGPDGRLFGFDQDGDAEGNIPDDPRFVFVRSNFKFLRSQLRYRGVENVDGILADLGVSSHHFDTEGRGFSFRFDSSVDMRMNQSAVFSAREFLAEYPADRMTAVFREYGEIDKPWKAASCIERFRAERPIETVGDLTDAVAPCTPAHDRNKFLSKLFQAIRIEVNGEMEALKMALEQSFKILCPGGRMVVISYHSLEDRLVKNYFRSGTFDGRQEKDFYGNVTTPWDIVTRKAVAPGERELEDNPRSRSARLRCARKK